jgi:hypothetical protein
MVPWLNKEMRRLKTSTRRLFNQAKRAGDWESYKMAVPVTIKESAKPNSPLGGITVGGLRMYLTWPDP